MSENPRSSELSVDRREDTKVTQEDGYASMQRTTRDVAAERRQSMYMVVRIVYTILGLLEILLGLRFVLKLIGANANSGFGSLIYKLSDIFVAPFNGLLGTPAAGGAVFEVTTLIAMAVYALLFWLVVRLIAIVADRPSARSVTRSVQEQSPDGSVQSSSTMVKR